MIKVSAIICTHNPRENSLLRVLEALKNQTLPVEAWELLLIDNASQVPLSERFDLSWHPYGQHIREMDLGLTPARLKGIAESKGEVLVFVDDDTVLDTDYLEQALSASRDFPFIGAWGGSISLECETPIPEWCKQDIWRLTTITVEEDIWSNLRNSFETAPVGAGLCIRKSVGERFVEWTRCSTRNKGLDRTGNNLTGYGDIDIVHCSMDIGLGAARLKRLHLTHLVPASRLTLDYFVRHAEGDTASCIMFRALRGLPIEEPKNAPWMATLKWKLHCLLRRVPYERREIWKATQRGQEKGFAWLAEYRKNLSKEDESTRKAC